jgi:Xaa-Pro aminopeptidase
MRQPATAFHRSAISDEQLERHRRSQRLAYQCAEETAAKLEPGVTEKEVAQRMKTWLVDAGVEDWFHTPFAWFGDRTAFRHFRLPLQFFPSNRRLLNGAPYILDVAPVFDGAAADIGYSGVLGENPVAEQLMDDLAAHRALILELVRQRQPLREIYDAVDVLAAEQGYENRHSEYPFGVIAHEVGDLPKLPVNRVVAGFGLRSLRSLVRSAVVGRRRGWSPLWAGGRRSDHAPVPGLWAVEPHLGRDGVGAKFEELLVVTADDAYWLDDDLPHVRRWNERKAAAA